MLQIIARVTIALIVIIAATFAILGIFGVYSGGDVKEGLIKGISVVVIIAASAAVVTLVMHKD